MKDRRQVEALAGEINKVIGRFRKEYDLSLASAVGTLVVIAVELILEVKNEE